MDGELHFRSWGTRAHVRSAGDRRLFASVFRWDKPIKLSTGGQEWFTRSEPPREAAVLALLHGGRRAGAVIEWRSSILGLDAVLLADGVGDRRRSAGAGRQARRAAVLAVVSRRRGSALHWRSVAQRAGAGVGGVR